MSHASHEEPGVADSDTELLAVNSCLSHSHRLVEPGLFLKLGELLLISRKIQGIADLHLFKPGFKAVPVADHADPVFGTDAKEGSAGGTGIPV